MDYKFPHISTIADVLPAIEGRDEFIVAERDGYQVINYTVAFDDTFPPVATAGGSARMRAEQSLMKALRRECRGLIFDHEGKLLARRYHKFFNVNERDETRLDKINWDKPHRILEKLDGSMISPIFVRGALRWTTKMGITDTAMQAETFVSINPEYVTFATRVISQGMTPIFEWLSRQQRIVVDYPTEKLVLTAVRDNLTGSYLSYEEMVDLANSGNIPVVIAHEITEDLINTIAKWEDSEGVVVRFDDGHMVKIKAEWYVLRHKSKDAIMREKNVLDYIINDKVDDVLPYLQEDDQKRLLSFQREVLAGIDATAVIYDAYMTQMYKNGIGKKDWAVKIRGRQSATWNLMPSIIFSMYDGKTAKSQLLQIISKNINTQTKVDDIRYLWGNVKWDYNYDQDI